MSARQIRCYDYVNRPYEQVVETITKKTARLFHEATQAASTRADSLASALKIELAGIEIGTNVRVLVEEVRRDPRDAPSPERTHVRLRWGAEKRTRLFPLMTAELSVYPLSASETQLDFLGFYEPPMGALGSAVDTIVGHRIAEACVHRFVAEVATHLRRSLDKSLRV